MQHKQMKRDGCPDTTATRCIIVIRINVIVVIPSIVFVTIAVVIYSYITCFTTIVVIVLVHAM